MKDLLNLTGRILIALLFLGGGLQKITSPLTVQAILVSVGLPEALVWPIVVFDLVAGLALIFGPWVAIWAGAMAIYCLGTRYFHWQLRADPWQVTIMVKNWSIAGGLFILAAQGPGRWVLLGEPGDQA